MQNFVIEGQRPLAGLIAASGSKNEVLPALAATLLSSEKVTLNNVPALLDVENMTGLLTKLGAKAKVGVNYAVITAKTISNSRPDGTLTRSMRGSILLAGPLLARTGKVSMAYPGGDVIGSRPVGVHLAAFAKLGIRVKESAGGIALSGKPKGAKVVLSEISVTATENLVMLASLATGTTEVGLAATEPHVEDLCRMLNKMGAKISGVGTHRLIIRGVSRLYGTTHSLIPDQLEAATFAILAAAAKSPLTVKGFVPEHHEVLLNKFDAMGVKYKLLPENKIKFSKQGTYTAVKVRTDIFPGFPTDYQAPFAVLMTQAEGESEIFETMYEGRLNYIYELQKMGAAARLDDNHTAVITGPTRLMGTEITTFDIRSGATLILAALIAKGKSVIHDIEHLDRGYERIDDKLRAIGAKIWRETK